MGLSELACALCFPGFMVRLEGHSHWRRETPLKGGWISPWLGPREARLREWPRADMVAAAEAKLSLEGDAVCLLPGVYGWFAALAYGITSVIRVAWTCVTMNHYAELMNTVLATPMIREFSVRPVEATRNHLLFCAVTRQNRTRHDIRIRPTKPRLCCRVPDPCLLHLM